MVTDIVFKHPAFFFHLDNGTQLCSLNLEVKESLGDLIRPFTIMTKPD